MPRYVWDWKRSLSIMRAIIRYEDASKAVPAEWVDELQGVLKEASCQHREQP
jgi:hypothetical protein